MAASIRISAVFRAMVSVLERSLAEKNSRDA